MKAKATLIVAALSVIIALVFVVRMKDISTPNEQQESLQAGDQAGPESEQFSHSIPKITDNHKTHQVEIPHGEEDNFEPLTFSDSPIGKKLTEHQKLISGSSSEAEAKYQASLKQLRKNPREVVEELYEVYKKAEEERYWERAQLVETMREMKDEAMFAPLSEIALSEIGPEKYSKTAHTHQSSQMEEGIIRLTAIEGLGHLAQNGHLESEAILKKIIETQDANLTLKRQAVREYLLAGDSDGTKVTYLQKILPRDQHHIITTQIDNPKDEAISKPEVFIEGSKEFIEAEAAKAEKEESKSEIPQL